MVPRVPTQRMIVDCEFSRGRLDRCARCPQTLDPHARGDCTLDIARFANPFVVPSTFSYLIYLKNEAPFACGILFFKQ
jgi:hypothetical protein